MTKKNVAALMLAGAMMTVGSGAMAAGALTEVPDVTTGYHLDKDTTPFPR